MSSPPRRVMHDAVPFAAPVHTGNHGVHAAHHAGPGDAQAAAVTVADHCLRCPYEAKVVLDGTTARMVLMFLRELVEQQPPAYPQFQQQTYACPMMKCYQKFSEPFSLVQHLLSCPELPNGEFDCDKCNNWHEFPTTEKDWSLWSGWSGKLLRHNSHGQGQGDHIQRKQSFSSKMREKFTLRKDPRKMNSSSDNHLFSSRPGTAASGASSIMTMGRCPEHQHIGFPGHGAGPNFPELQKPAGANGVNGAGAPQIDGNMFWQGLEESITSSIRDSAVSSIAPSTTFDPDTTKAGTSTNTSQTTLFNPGLQVISQQPFMFPTSFDNGSAPLVGHGHSNSPSGMSIDEPLVNEGALSPTDMPPTPNDSQPYWTGKQDLDTARPTPVSSPFFVEQNMVHPLSRAMSRESMQSPMVGLYQRALSEGTQMDAMSPHSDHVHHSHHSHHAHHTGGEGMDGRSSPTEELVCDECQWKPRGVRENLRGYLRKHKNTHKGLRLPCDVPGCTKTFSRLDNLKKHKKDKHGIEDPGSLIPLKRVAEEYVEHIEEDTTEIKRPPVLHERPPGLHDADIRGVSGDYSMLWPALHF